ncbi:Dabb family protein [archaeon]|nr:MAG: Dabb family protein [archaeon]
MIYHVVLFKFKQSLSAEEVARYVAGVDRLKQIVGVVSTQCGEVGKSFYSNYNDRTRGYTHTLLIVLEGAEDLERYDKSPLHEEVKQSCIIPLLDKTAESPAMAIDYFGKLPEDRTDESPKTQNSFTTYSTYLAVLGLGAIAGFGLARWQSKL